MLIYRHLHVLQRYLRHIKKEKEEEEEATTTTKRKKQINVNDPLIIKTTLIKTTLIKTNDYFLFCTHANQMIETNETKFKQKPPFSVTNNPSINHTYLHLEHNHLSLPCEKVIQHTLRYFHFYRCTML